MRHWLNVSVNPQKDHPGEVHSCASRQFVFKSVTVFRLSRAQRLSALNSETWSSAPNGSCPVQLPPQNERYDAIISRVAGEQQTCWLR
jgi:hypothetical protein